MAGAYADNLVAFLQRLSWTTTISCGDPQRNKNYRNHLSTIKGIGDVTAAVLTAKIVDIDRFEDANHLVGYFGIFPVEAASGVDRDGKRRAPRRWVMCPRGSDLVRRYAWFGVTALACQAP